MSAIFSTRTNQGLQLLIKVGGGYERVYFSPIFMFGNTSHATYTTCDKEVIEALKNHKHFNSFFFLEHEDIEEVVERNPMQGVNEPKGVDYRALCPNQDAIIEELSVVDLATAQNWCQRTHGAVFRARKAETIKQEAAEKYNTLFPNFN